MESDKDIIDRGLIVIIGDNTHPRRDLPYKYLSNLTAERKVIYCVDPLAKYDEFWTDKLDDRFIFDHWIDAIGKGILKLQANDIESALVVHNHIDMKSDVFNEIIEAAKSGKVLLIITILDRGQRFPEALLHCAHEVIFTKKLQN